jgi:sucrose-6-phosphate hydrolase SacC (GH32 family)
VYVDRRHSGNVGFHPAFAGVHRGPLQPDESGAIRLRVLVDACSVEVFGNDGETVLTELVFPDAASDGVELFGAEGSCRVRSCRVHTLKSVWHGS